MIGCKSRATHAALWAGLVFFMSSCMPGIPVTASPSIDAPATEGIECSKKFVPPKITEIQPVEGTPGSEMKVIGTGGYEQDTCGGYDESAREFEMYLDDAPVASLQCYVNRCEAKLTLPSTISSGKHCLSLHKDNCEFEFQVAAK